MLHSTSCLQAQMGSPSLASLDIRHQWCRDIRPLFGDRRRSMLRVHDQQFWNALVRLRAFALMTNDQLIHHGFYCPLAIRRYADDQRFQRENPHLSLPNRRIFLQEFHIQKFCNRCDCCYRYLSKKEVQRGHIVPKRWKGSFFSHNLLVLCSSCNYEMGSVDPHLHPHFFPQDRLEYLVLPPSTPSLPPSSPPSAEFCYPPLSVT